MQPPLSQRCIRALSMSAPDWEPIHQLLAAYVSMAVLPQKTSTNDQPVIEMFLTCGLCFTIFLLAVEKHKSTFLAPVGIGLALFIGQLAGVFFSGGSLNPTRSFSVDVANASFPNYHWIYWLGPGLGACMAVLVYRLVKALEYETANPCQDCDGQEAQQQEGKEAIWIPTTSDSETDTQAFQSGPRAEEGSADGN